MPWGFFSIYPNLYIALVGPSGSRKGTAMSLGQPFLLDLGVKLAAEAITREALIRELRQSSSTQVGIDGQVIMHSSLTIFSKELTVFLGYNNVQLMSDLCDWYDCQDRWTYRTKNMGTDEIMGVWVNLIGATTPTLLSSALPRDAIGGGLLSRMILVYESRKGKRVEVPYLTDEELKLGKLLLADLEQILSLSGDFRVTEGFLRKWSDWYKWSDENPPFEDERFGGYIERRAIHVLKLCIIVSASRSNDMIITDKDLERAISLLGEVEQRMPIALSGVSRTEITSLAIKVWSYIAMKRVLNYRDLQMRFIHELTNEELDKIIATLQATGIIKMSMTGNNTLIQYTGKKEDEVKYGVSG